MRRLIVVIVLVLVAAIAYRSLGSAETGTGSLTLPEPAPNVGDPAPTFTVPGETRENFTLDDQGVYVLAFWSTYNRQSNKYRPDFERLAQEYSDDDITFAAVYVNSPPDIRSEDYEVLQDSTGNLTALYNVKRVPRLFLIEDGRVRLAQIGFYDDTEDEPGSGEQLEDEIRNYLDERRVIREAREEGS